MDRTKTGVIGVGRQGILHARMYQELPDSLLLGIYDIDREKAQAAAKELGVIAFDSMEELIKEVEALSIVIPPEEHHKVAIQALRANKHVLIEGPISHNLDQAQELVDVADSHNCTLIAGQIERYNAALVALEDIKLFPMCIESDRQTSFKQDRENSSVVLEHMLHDIDMVLHLVKSKPQTIHANGAAVISPDIDIVNAQVKFENGCVANLSASRLSTKKIAKMRLYQNGAQINLDFLEGKSEIFYLRGNSQSHFKDGTMGISLGRYKSREILYNRLRREQVNPLKNELRHFITGLRNNLPIASSGADNLTALKVAYEIIERVNQQQKMIHPQSGRSS